MHNAVSSTRESSKKSSIKSNTNIQKSLQSNNCRGRRKFPNELMGQTIATNSTHLNLLRQSNIAPTVSAYQYIHGAFDYHKMLLATMGCAVQIHERSEKIMGFNLIDGWYLRTSPEHYQCHVIYVKKQEVKEYQTRCISSISTLHNLPYCQKTQ